MANIRPAIGLSRSTIIVGAMLGGYVLYIAAKGDIGQYLSLMTPSTQQISGPAALDSGGTPASSGVPGASPSFTPSGMSGTAGGATFGDTGFPSGYGLPAAGGSGFGLPGLGF